MDRVVRQRLLPFHARGRASAVHFRLTGRQLTSRRDDRSRPYGRRLAANRTKEMTETTGATVTLPCSHDAGVKRPLSFAGLWSSRVIVSAILNIAAKIWRIPNLFTKAFR